MEVDWTISVGNIITIVGILLAALSAFFLQRYQIAKAIETADRAYAEAVGALNKNRELGAELAKSKLEAAEKYATHKSLEQLEERIIQAVERIGDRLDRVFERTASQTRPRRSTD